MLICFFFFPLGKGKLPQSDPRRARFSVNAGIWNVRGDAKSLVKSVWHEYPMKLVQNVEHFSSANSVPGNLLAHTAINL